MMRDRSLAFLFDLDGKPVKAYRVYQDLADLLRHLDEVGARTED
jgi:hypothetical protein